MARRRTSRSPQWDLRLYVAGNTLRSAQTIQKLKEVCEQHLAGDYRIEIIDLLRNPKRARLDQILAIPTLVRKKPPPKRKLVGDLSNTERMLHALGVQFRTA